MFRANGRTLIVEREPICTIGEYISGGVREELLTWAFFMSQYHRDLRPAAAMKHDSYERHRGAMRQRGWGFSG